MIPAADAELAGGDGLSMRRWAAVFVGFLLATGLPALWLLARMDQPWRQVLLDPGRFDLPAHQALKLLIFTVYLSMCSSLLPLPTGWIVAAIATREVALAPTMGQTALLAATFGAIGSTMANLNEYHIFTLMLRSRRIAALRDRPLVRRGSTWFAHAPFTWLLTFQIVPVPVDIMRMLAAANRYPLGRFAVANFVGRFIRYGVLAAAAYAVNISAAAAAAIMLAVAGVLALVRFAPRLFTRRRRAAVEGTVPAE